MQDEQTHAPAVMVLYRTVHPEGQVNPTGQGVLAGRTNEYSVPFEQRIN